VANIFGAMIGKIQENMLRIDIQQVLRYGDTFFSESDTAYLIFLVMGIVGYFTVPSVANYIVHAGGGNTLLYKASNVFTGGSRAVVSSAVSGANTAINSMTQSPAVNQSGSSRISSENPGNSGSGGYMYDKLSGK